MLESGFKDSKVCKKVLINTDLLYKFFFVHSESSDRPVPSLVRNTNFFGAQFKSFLACSTIFLALQYKLFWRAVQIFFGIQCTIYEWNISPTKTTYLKVRTDSKKLLLFEGSQSLKGFIESNIQSVLVI